MSRTKQITWELKIERVWGATVEVATLTTDGRSRAHRVDLRIDARDPKAIRVDMHTIGPWEAIDGGNAQATLRGAKALAKRWLEAANAERTVHPRLAA